MELPACWQVSVFAGAFEQAVWRVDASWVPGGSVRLQPSLGRSCAWNTGSIRHFHSSGAGGRWIADRCAVIWQWFDSGLEPIGIQLLYAAAYALLLAFCRYNVISLYALLNRRRQQADNGRT